VVLSGQFRDTDNQYTGAYNLTFHHNGESFSGQWLHSETDFGGWIGVRDTLVDKFQFRGWESKSAHLASIMLLDGRADHIVCGDIDSLSITGTQPYTIDVSIRMESLPPRGRRSTLVSKAHERERDRTDAKDKTKWGGQVNYVVAITSNGTVFFNGKLFATVFQMASIRS
jgi:hypothetical protein